MLREWYSSPNFRVCPFINAVLEIADASHKAHRVAVELRESIRQIIMGLTIEHSPNGATFAQSALSVLIDANRGN